MPSFESPIGNKRIFNSQMREFEVPDESGYESNSIEYNQEELLRKEREFKEAKERKLGKERLSEGAKKRLEMLLGMTRTIRTVKIGEMQIVFQSLKSKEMKEAILESSKFDNTLQAPYEIRKNLLARSIVSIEGVEFSQFVSSDSLETKLSFIDELDDAFLSRLFEEYLKTAEEAKNKFSIKNNEDANNVIEDLKK